MRDISYFSLPKNSFFCVCVCFHMAKAGYTKDGKELNDERWNGMTACLLSYFTLRKISHQLFAQCTTSYH